VRWRRERKKRAGAVAGARQSSPTLDVVPTYERDAGLMNELRRENERAITTAIRRRQANVSSDLRPMLVSAAR
jgi:hypothetical protein